MKKSFKKAGAAVLSMAMLLSMGAVSMPVYAVEDEYGNNDATGAPAQVTVKITGLSTLEAYHQGEGSKEDPNGDGPDTLAKKAWESKNSSHTGTYTEKYDYLNLGGTDDFFKTVESANVKMYRIAKLDNGRGWDWEDYINDYVDNHGGTIPGFTDFASLLANKDGETHTASGITGQVEFNTSSEDLKQMASYFERIVDELETNIANTKKAWEEAGSPDTGDTKDAYDAALAKLAGVVVGEGTLNQATMASGLTIPTIAPTELDKNHDGVVDENEKAATQNVIGYYLIVTQTDQSGVMVQPVLVSLHNGEKKIVSVKGSTLKFEKTMTEITKADGTSKGSLTNKTDTFDSTEHENLKNGLVAQDDIVKYKIDSQLPKYDPNVVQSAIKPFVITDTASNGITITAPFVTGGTGDAATNIDPDKFKVYLAKTANDLDDEDARWELTGNKLPNVGDYQLTMKSGNHGFDLTITGFQMIQEDTRRNVAGQANNMPAGGKYKDGETHDNLPDQVQYIVNDDKRSAETMSQATLYKTGDGEANQSGASNMYNLYIRVEFEATVNKTTAGADINGDESQLGFDRTFNEFIDLEDIVAGDVTALGTKEEAAKQVLRVKLFAGETQYNQTYDDDLWETWNGENSAFKSLGDTELGKIVTALSGAGYDGTSRTPEATLENLKAENADGQTLRILALLAKDRKNIERNGEYNTAKMTYGNRYATGGGEVKMTTNYSKVYSVGLKLSKFIETLKVQAQPKIDNYVSAYANYYNSIKDKPFSLTATVDGTETTVNFTGFSDTNLTDPTSSSNEAKVLTALGALPSLDDTGATDAQKDLFKETDPTLNENQQKALAYLVAQENTRRTDNGKYDVDGSNKQAVEGAVFHLKQISANTETPDLVKDYGYAVSTSDGRLYKLTVDKTTYYASKAAAEAAIGDVASSHTDEVGIAFPDGANWYIGYVKGTKADDGTITYTETNILNGNDETWDMLDIGYYEIEELYVPVGFKKWDKARFQIAAETDDGTYLQDGAWTGAYSANALIGAAQPSATSSHGLASIAETKVGVANFNYYTDKTTHEYTTDTAHSDGVLQKDMYNEYLDELPATGGMGTVLFTAGGIAVILMAGALFVVYMKKRNAEEEE